MQIYKVGGCVRDALLGLPIHDDDYLVVGSSPEEMTALGYKPVGKDFPVFLHPETHAEYALARTERKTAVGYKGFAIYAAPDVKLEDDLIRRDLTMNAIAMDENGNIHDPHGGRADIAARILRHVSPAFAEDPLRILRVARFAARFTTFTVAHETLQLMRNMVAAGEVAALVPERVWQEISRGLMEKQPSRMMQVLHECGALAVLLPEIAALDGVPQRADYHPEVDTLVHNNMVIDQAAKLKLPLAGRFAALVHDLGKATTPADILPRHIGHEIRTLPLLKKLCARLRVPKECAQFASIVAAEHGNIHRCISHTKKDDGTAIATKISAAAIVRLLSRCDAFRQPARFLLALAACEADARGRLGLENDPYPQRTFLTTCLAAAQTVNLGAVVALAVSKMASPDTTHNAAMIQAAIAKAREHAIQTSISCPVDLQTS